MVDQPDTAADIRRVYSHTGSEELRFAIEESFLQAGDALYESLNPPGGPVASMVTLGNGTPTTNNVAFAANYRQRRDFRDQWKGLIICHGTIKDLYDRILVAQSVVERMPLVTADEGIRKYGINMRDATS